MASGVIGLEVAEEAIRAVEVSRKGRRPIITAAGEVMLPPGAARDSEVVDPDALSLALRQLWSQAGLRSRRVVLGVANRRILVREYVAPRLPPAQLRAALPYEVQDLLPVPVEQSVLDFFPTQESEEQVVGLLVAAVSETIEALLANLATAKIRADAVDFLPFGLTRFSPVVEAPAEQAIGIASVGFHTTNFVVSVAGVPRFVRIIPADLTEEIPEVSVEDPADKEAAVARRVMENTGRMRAVEDNYEDLVGRLRSTVSFYESRAEAIPLAGIYLTGAASSLPGLGAAVARSLSVGLRPLGIADVAGLGRSVQAKGDPPPSLMNALGIALGSER